MPLRVNIPAPVQPSAAAGSNGAAVATATATATPKVAVAAPAATGAAKSPPKSVCVTANRVTVVSVCNRQPCNRLSVDDVVRVSTHNVTVGVQIS